MKQDKIILSQYWLWRTGFLSLVTSKQRQESVHWDDTNICTSLVRLTQLCMLSIFNRGYTQACSAQKSRAVSSLGTQLSTLALPQAKGKNRPAGTPVEAKASLVDMAAGSQSVPAWTERDTLYFIESLITQLLGVPPAPPHPTPQFATRLKPSKAYTQHAWTESCETGSS